MVKTELTQPDALHIWLHASRPKTLPAALAPVIIGTAMAFADGRLHLLAAVMTALAALFIQIGTNYANDYFDFFKGADDNERLGPVRATQAGLVKPAAMKQAFIAAYALATLFGAYLVYRGGWPIVIIGFLSILFGIAYTGGPYPLGYNGLGDIFVFIFFGPVAVGGAYYVQALEINYYVLLAGIAPGLFSTAILTVNNLRDINTDRKAGKKTLAVRWGENFSRLEYLFCLLVAPLWVIPIVLLTRAHYAVFIVFLIWFAAIFPLKIVFMEKPGVIYNYVLAATGRLLLIYSLLFSTGWLI